MKHSLRYGFYLSGALILSYVLYYFIDQNSMFRMFSKATIWELLLQVGFMFFAILKSKDALTDSGVSFKIALITLVVGLLFSGLFRTAFSNFFAEQLNPIYLEAKKADVYSEGNLFGQDPLEALEHVELMENTIQNDFKFSEYLIGGIFGILLFCIPFALVVSFLSRQILKLKKRLRIMN